jgi:hypothetical protein
MEMAQILDTGSAERNFEGQLSAVFAFFESRAGIRIGNSIDRGQIDSEFVATHKSRFSIANTGWIHLRRWNRGGQVQVKSCATPSGNLGPQAATMRLDD